ncbi:MAG: putative PEP-binding protein [Candidatus Omnitrophota bacterium]
MDLQSPKNKRWIRAIALFVVFAFINQDLVWAQGGNPVWSKPQTPASSNTQSNNINLNGNIAIPKDIAVTKEVYQGQAASGNGTGSKTIINIQDAHASLTAQESISSILDSLVTNYDMKLVAVEGSSGYIDTSILKTFPDESIRKDTAKYLMSQGKMSAGEFFSITSNKSIKLYGIEDKDLYLENVDQFRKVYESNQSTKKDLDNLIKTLNELKDKLYTPELKQIESNSVLHEDGKITFTDRWKFVSELASKYNIDYKKYSNLSKLVESLKLEKEISFTTANKERDQLIDELSKKLNKPQLEALVLKSLSFKTNKITQGEYYSYLQDLANKTNIDPVPYKNLINYTEYIAIYESIDLLEIFNEVKAYEDAIIEKLYTNPDQKKLHDLSKCVNYIKALFELKLTNGDFEYLEKHIEDCKADIPKEIFANLDTAMDFYRTAEARNQAILRNTIKRMDAEGTEVAALITGGYHTKGISDLLKQKQTSYLVILPKFDASKGTRPYVAILTNRNDQYQDQVRAFIKEIVVTSLDKAHKENKDIDALKKMWKEGYRASYEKLVKEGAAVEQAANSKQSAGNESSQKADSNLGDKTIAVGTFFPVTSGLVRPEYVDEVLDGLQYPSRAPTVPRGDEAWRAALESRMKGVEDSQCVTDIVSRIMALGGTIADYDRVCRILEVPQSSRAKLRSRVETELQALREMAEQKAGENQELIDATKKPVDEIEQALVPAPTVAPEKLIFETPGLSEKDLVGFKSRTLYNGVISKKGQGYEALAPAFEYIKGGNDMWLSQVYHNFILKTFDFTNAKDSKIEVTVEYLTPAGQGESAQGILKITILQPAVTGSEWQQLTEDSEDFRTKGGASLMEKYKDQGTDLITRHSHFLYKFGNIVKTTPVLLRYQQEPATSHTKSELFISLAGGAKEAPASGSKLKETGLSVVAALVGLRAYYDIFGGVSAVSADQAYQISGSLIGIPAPLIVAFFATYAAVQAIMLIIKYRSSILYVMRNLDLDIFRPNGFFSVITVLLISSPVSYLLWYGLMPINLATFSTVGLALTSSAWYLLHKAVPLSTYLMTNISMRDIAAVKETVYKIPLKEIKGKPDILLPHIKSLVGIRMHEQDANIKREASRTLWRMNRYAKGAVRRALRDISRDKKAPGAYRDEVINILKEFRWDGFFPHPFYRPFFLSLAALMLTVIPGCSLSSSGTPGISNASALAGLWPLALIAASLIIAILSWGIISRYDLRANQLRAPPARDILSVSPEEIRATIRAQFVREHSERVGKIAALIIEELETRGIRISTELKAKIQAAAAGHDFDSPVYATNRNDETTKAMIKRLRNAGIDVPDKPSANMAAHERLRKRFAEAKPGEFTTREMEYALDIFTGPSAIWGMREKGISCEGATPTAAAIIFHHNIDELDGYLASPDRLKEGWTEAEKEETKFIESVLVAADVIENGMNVFKTIACRNKDGQEPLDVTPKFFPPQIDQRVKDAYQGLISGSNKSRLSRLLKIRKDAARISRAEYRELVKLGRAPKAGPLGRFFRSILKAIAPFVLQFLYEARLINFIMPPSRKPAVNGQVPQTDGYGDLIVSRRIEILKRRLNPHILRSLLSASPQDDFTASIIGAMPIEHIRYAAAGRLVDEITYAALLSKIHAGEKEAITYDYFFYNPPDAAHTELIIFGRDNDSIVEEVTGIISAMREQSKTNIKLDSNWSGHDGPNGTFYAFEIVNEIEAGHGGKEKLALNPDQTGSLNKLLGEKRFRFVDCNAAIKSDKKLYQTLSKIKEEIKKAVPRVIAAPSLTTRDVKFLWVQRGEPFVDHKNVLVEDYITPRDTDRQKAAKIDAQKKDFTVAFERATANYALAQSTKDELSAIMAASLTDLQQDGKSVLHAFISRTLAYIKTLWKSDKPQAKILFKILKDVKQYFNDLTRLGEGEIDQELVDAKAVANAFISNQKILQEAAKAAGNMEGFHNAKKVVDMVECFLITITANSSRSQEAKSRAYKILLDEVRKIGPSARAMLDQIEDVKRATHIPADVREKKIKVLEALPREAYPILVEYLRMMHNYSHKLPDNFVEKERERADDIVRQVYDKLPGDRLTDVTEFFREFEDSLGTFIRPGAGITASQLINDLMVVYIKEHPELAESVKMAAGLFTFLMEERKAETFSDEEQPKTIFVTEGMNQLYFNSLIDANPFLGAVGTEEGNSRSHWAITARDILIEGRDVELLVIAGIAKLKGLKAGDMVIVDGINRRIIINPSPEIIAHYTVLAAKSKAQNRVFREHAKEEARTLDGAELKLYSDIPRVGAGAMLTEDMGSSGIGLLRMENEYMEYEAPSEDMIYKTVLEAADHNNGIVTIRTLDMAKDKIGDMASLYNRIVKNEDGTPAYEGTRFYFEDPKGQEVIRTQLKALIGAYAASRNKNIRVLIPMVENDVQAKAVRALIESIKDELSREGNIPRDLLDRMEFGAMIETPSSCMAVGEIIKAGKFDFISFGTNDLTRRSYSQFIGRDEGELEEAYHRILTPFRRSFEYALDRVNEMNRHLPVEKRIKVAVCGEWPNSRKFLFYVLGLMKKFEFINIILTSNSYRIGELKEYARNVSQDDCYKIAIKDGDINDELNALVEEVSSRIDEKHKIDEATTQLMADMAAGQGAAPATIYAFKKLLGPFGWFHNRFTAPFTEEFFKVGLPVFILNQTGSWELFSFLSITLGVIYYILHILNKEAPPSLTDRKLSSILKYPFIVLRFCLDKFLEMPRNDKLRLLLAPLAATLAGFGFMSIDPQTALWNSIQVHMYINIIVTVVNFFYRIYEVVGKGEIETHPLLSPATISGEGEKRTAVASKEVIKQNVAVEVQRIAADLISENNRMSDGRYNILGLVIDDIEVRSANPVKGKITVTVITKEFNKDCIDPFLINISQRLESLGYDLPVLQKPYWILRYMGDENFEYMIKNPHIVAAGDELQRIIAGRNKEEAPKMPASGIEFGLGRLAPLLLVVAGLSAGIAGLAYSLFMGNSALAANIGISLVVVGTIVDWRSLVSPLDKMIKEEDAASIRAAFSRLNEKDQILLRYRFMHDFTFKQIGAMFDVTESKAHALYDETMDRLQLHLFSKLTTYEKEEMARPIFKEMETGKSRSEAERAASGSWYGEFGSAAPPVFIAIGIGLAIVFGSPQALFAGWLSGQPAPDTAASQGALSWLKDLHAALGGSPIADVIMIVAAVIILAVILNIARDLAQAGKNLIKIAALATLMYFLFTKGPDILTFICNLIDSWSVTPKSESSHWFGLSGVITMLASGTLFGAAIVNGESKTGANEPIIKQAMEKIRTNLPRLDAYPKERQQLFDIYKYLSNLQAIEFTEGKIYASDHRVRLPKTALSGGVALVARKLILAGMLHITNGKGDMQAAADAIIGLTDFNAAAPKSAPAATEPKKTLSEDDILQIMNGAEGRIKSSVGQTRQTAEIPAPKKYVSESSGVVVNGDLIGQLGIYYDENHGNMEDSWKLFEKRLDDTFGADMPEKQEELLEELMNAFAILCYENYKKAAKKDTKHGWGDIVKIAAKSLAGTLIKYANKHEAAQRGFLTRKLLMYKAAQSMRQDRLYKDIRIFKVPEELAHALDEATGNRLKNLANYNTGGHMLHKPQGPGSQAAKLLLAAIISLIASNAIAGDLKESLSWLKNPVPDAMFTDNLNNLLNVTLGILEKQPIIGSIMVGASALILIWFLIDIQRSVIKLFKRATILLVVTTIAIVIISYQQEIGIFLVKMVDTFMSSDKPHAAANLAGVVTTLGAFLWWGKPAKAKEVAAGTEIAIYIPVVASEYFKKNLRNSLEGKNAIVTSDENEFKSITGKDVPGIILNESIRVGDVTSEDFGLYVEAVKVIAKDKNGEKLRRFINFLKKKLDLMDRFDIDDARKAIDKLSGKDVFTTKMQKALARRLIRQKELLSKVYNNIALPEGKFDNTVAIATTEMIAETDIFSFENIIQASEKGIISPIIYGNRFKTRQEAEAFASAGLRATGYSQSRIANALKSIVFVSKYDSDNKQRSIESLVLAIRAEIYNKLGVRVDFDKIGIRAIENEVRVNGERSSIGKLLEVRPTKIGGVDTYVTLNTYQVLLEVVNGAFLDGKNIPGLSRDEKGIYIYMSPIVPYDYNKEIGAYRDAITLLAAAA